MEGEDAKQNGQEESESIENMVQKARAVFYRVRQQGQMTDVSRVELAWIHNDMALRKRQLYQQKAELEGMVTLLEKRVWQQVLTATDEAGKPIFRNESQRETEAKIRIAEDAEINRYKASLLAIASEMYAIDDAMKAIRRVMGRD